MEFLANQFNILKEYCFKKYSKDAGTMLLHSATLAWTTSALAQVLGIMHNDKISKDQKKFMVPQEMADAAINIFFFYVMTNKLQTYTKSLASSGKILPVAIKEFCKREGILLGEKSTNIGKAIADKLAPLKPEITEGRTKEDLARIRVLSNIQDKIYAPFESGMKIIGNVIGGIISCNIITPMLRNPFAAMKQRTAMAHEQEALTPSERPIYLAQNRFNMDKYIAKTAYPSGSLKI